MAFFQNAGDKFFNPFACRNREIYFDCISQLIERSKEVPVLYEADARDCLILYLQNCMYAIQREDIGEEIDSGRTPQENASAILRYFRACGWIAPQEIGRSGDNIASVSVYCRKLVDALHRIFDSEANGAITNHIFSMYEILKASSEKEGHRSIRPYSNILVPLLDHEWDLKNELLTLRESIREIMRAIMRMADVNSFGQFLMKDEILDRFFNDYFFIKKSGLLPTYLSDIERMLARLRRSELCGRMVREYMALKKVEEAKARERIDLQFDELERFIQIEYQQDMDYIDKRINTYYNLYSTRMAMVLNNRMNLESQLNQLLLLLKELDDGEREEVLGRLSQAHRLLSIGYVGRKSFERRKKPNPNREQAGLPQEELTEEEKRRLTAQLLEEQPDRYGLAQVEQYLDRKLAHQDSLTVEEWSVATRDDAMMIAASMIYSGTVGFPYEVEFQDGMAQTEVAAISRVEIKRRMP